MPSPQFRRYKGKLEKTKGKVHMRIEIAQSKAQYQRLGQVVFDYDCLITSTHMMKCGQGMSATLILKIPFEHIDEAMEALNPIEYRYSSPTFFYNSAICGIYDTPEDEVNDKPCSLYRRFKDAQDRSPHLQSRRRRFDGE